MPNPSLAWLTARPIAHRGFHDKRNGVIENTETAFAHASEGNYTIECDLQMTGDGEAVVFHDETLERLTSAKGLVKTRTTKVLKSINITGSADKMQTLAELLEQVDGKVPLVIELKSHWDGDTLLARRALDVLAGYKGQYALMSFDPDLVSAVMAMSPQTIRGMTADRADDSYYDALPEARRVGLQKQSYLENTKPHFVSFAFRDLPIPAITRFRDAGNPVITWTIRSKEDEASALKFSDQVTFEGYAA